MNQKSENTVRIRKMVNNLKSFTSPINIVLKYRLLLKYFSWVCSSSVLIVPKISNCYHNCIFEYHLSIDDNHRKVRKSSST